MLESINKLKKQTNKASGWHPTTLTTGTTTPEKEKTTADDPEDSLEQEAKLVFGTRGSEVPGRNLAVPACQLGGARPSRGGYRKRDLAAQYDQVPEVVDDAKIPKGTLKSLA